MGAIRWVGILLGRNFLGGEYPGWKFSGWELSGRNHPGGNFASGSFHVTLKTLILIYIYIYIYLFFPAWLQFLSYILKSYVVAVIKHPNTI